MGQAKPETQVPRTALMTMLDSLMEKRVIYIQAPAGFGKTVSSMLWQEYRKEKANTKNAWISLDTYCNKTSSFCERFVSALAGLQLLNTELQNLTDHPSFSTAPVEFTMRALSYFKEDQNECIIVFDDLHNITNEDTLKLLPELFKRLPDNCIVLLLSREAPPDSFSEIAAKEEFDVVDARYLQFTVNEIKQLFENNGQVISVKQAEEIREFSGGWAIGIRAMLLANESSYNINLADRYFDNYLKTHVWGRWEENIRNFMVMISVADELTPEYCDWLTAENETFNYSNSAELLAGLARENAFLRKTGKNTYRFHDLFRDFLNKTLAERGEEALNRQWTKAGDWFFDKADYFRSIEYYLKGKNEDGTAESLYHMYDHKSPSASIEETLQIIEKSLSESIVKKYPFLLEVHAWSAYV